MPEAESDLVARCRRGEADAWNAVFDQQYDPVARFLYQLSPDLSREDVEDLGQEVFLSAVRHLDSFRGNSALQTWLFRIALNKARDFLEKRSAAKRGGGQAPKSLDAPDPETGLAPDVAGIQAGPDEAAATTEEGILLRRALDGLGEPCRELIELRYFGDLGHEEIGRVLGITAKAVGSRLPRCLARLAEQVAGAASRGPMPTKAV